MGGWVVGCSDVDLSSLWKLEQDGRSSSDGGAANDLWINSVLTLLYAP